MTASPESVDGASAPSNLLWCPEGAGRTVVRHRLLTISGFALAGMFATVVAGRLCDRLGPVRPLIAGIMAFVADLVVAGTAVARPVWRTSSR